MSSVFDVAKWFLSKGQMTHKKLQKLCYYAQAWHCALLGQPLFSEFFQAWVHGPVSPELYRRYSSYKWLDIPKESNPPTFPPKTTEVLEAVWNTYGPFDGDQLEAQTHGEAPWKDARGELQPYESCYTVIPVEAMRKYYSGVYEASQND